MWLENKHLISLPDPTLADVSKARKTIVEIMKTSSNHTFASQEWKNENETAKLIETSLLQLSIAHNDAIWWKPHCTDSTA
jgi:hypothetical protein